MKLKALPEYVSSLPNTLATQAYPNHSQRVESAGTPAAGNRAQAAARRAPQPAVFVIGDSISIDYHNHLRKLARGHYAYARKGGLKEALQDLDRPEGANAGNSEQVLDYLRQALAQGTIEADTVLINCGLHDIKRESARHPAAIPLDAYKANLETIVQLLQRHQKSLIWITTTPVDERRHRECMQAFCRYETDLADYNAAASEIMSAHRIPVIDLFSFTKQQKAPYRDHVHFQPSVVERQAAFLHEQILHHLKSI